LALSGRPASRMYPRGSCRSGPGVRDHSGPRGGDPLLRNAPQSLWYYVPVDSDLDGQIKGILKAQEVPVKQNLTTYHVIYGVNRSIALSLSKTLHFRHAASLPAFIPLPFTATYKAGDKSTLFDAVALDSSMTMRDALGPNNTYSGKFARLPNDLVHRITMQVQFLPNPNAEASL